MITYAFLIKNSFPSAIPARLFVSRVQFLYFTCYMEWKRYWKLRNNMELVQLDFEDNKQLGQ